MNHCCYSHSTCAVFIRIDAPGAEFLRRTDILVLQATVITMRMRRLWMLHVSNSLAHNPRHFCHPKVFTQDIDSIWHKNAFQSKAHLPLADRKSNTYNLTFEWPWPHLWPWPQTSQTMLNWCPGSKISIFHEMTLTLTQWPWYSNLT